MIWHDWMEFLSMGGYGLYVWGSFGAVLAAMLIELWQLGRRRARLRAAQGDGARRRGWTP
jgi:heme exporter protein D